MTKKDIIIVMALRYTLKDGDDMERDLISNAILDQWNHISVPAKRLIKKEIEVSIWSSAYSVGVWNKVLNKGE